MAAINFPASPAVNQVFTDNNTSWIWDGASWNSVNPSSGNLIFNGGTLDAGVLSAGTNSVVATEISNIGLPAPNASGGTIVSNGTAWVSVSPALVDVQTFNSSKTWNKPATGNFALIQMWGGGGAGNRNGTASNTAGGGGGSFFEVTIPLSYLADSVSITVGAGGIAPTITANGGNGGVTSVPIANSPSGATTIYASGGQGGGIGVGGAGGAGFSLPSNPSISPVSYGINVYGASGADAAVNSAAVSGDLWGGGGGGANGLIATPGANGLWGGAGGTRGTGAAVRSAFGGSGGNNTLAGQQPGGGGGSSTVVNTTGTNGGAGRVIITVS